MAERDQQQQAYDALTRRATAETPQPTQPQQQQQATTPTPRAVAPGLSNAFAEIWDEMRRLGTQGSAELAAVLFGGGTSNAFVQYGPGQRPAQDHASDQARDADRGGVER